MSQAGGQKQGCKLGDNESEPSGNKAPAGGGRPDDIWRRAHGREQPKTVQLQSIKKKVLRILDHFDGAPMAIIPVSCWATPVDSEYAGNVAMHSCVFGVINTVLAKWPDDPFVRRWRLLQFPPQPQDTPTKSSAGSWYHPSNNPKEARIEVCQLIYTEDGTLKVSSKTALFLLGKEWSVFCSNQPEEVVRSGELDLSKAYAEGTLSKDALYALHQCCWYLFHDEVDRVILYTPPVLWVIRCVERELKFISISEPITANDTNPSTMEVVFAVVYHEIMAMKQQMTGELMPTWLTKAMKENDVRPIGRGASLIGEPGVSGGDTMGDDPLGGKTGDELLSELDETKPPMYGNSVVRTGRLNGTMVAAKIVRGDAQKWVQEEIENEIKILDTLRPLQGSIIPETVFVGTIRKGRDKLLITKYVEGDYIDKVPMTKDLAANARSGLKAIHDRGYIHSDLMPRNILVRDTGECIFLDFGQAKRAKNDEEKKTDMGDLEVWLK